MQVLTVDVGTGTQDVHLFRSGLSLENGYKLVLPSPTMIVRRRIQEATRLGEDLLLTGVTMGGGPSQWAAQDHLRAGRRIFATPDAARSFNDDLEWVRREMGVTVVGEDEAAALKGVTRILLQDFDFGAIESAFRSFGVGLQLDGLAVAVFDHGAAPPGVSDRQFRFDYLLDRLRLESKLSAFAHRAEDVPPVMTRMQAVVQSAKEAGCPVVVMDTAPAAALGATFDPIVAARERLLIANVGNFHTLAFRLGPEGIEGLFEHHTGLLSQPAVEALLCGLADGSLSRQPVFDDNGHGALIFRPDPFSLDDGPFGVVVTGPRRGLLRGSRLRPYFAVPFGDMMLAGCIGLLAATAEKLPQLAGPIRAGLAGTAAERAPWEAG
jgi:uncharacterized protein (DUF1786 family)